jgi:tryptophan-rich sensory protein
MAQLRVELIILPPVLCPLLARALSGGRRFGDVYDRPAPLQPPGWVFGPVWAALYTMLGYCLALAVRGGEDLAPAAPWAMLLLLTLNVAWTPLFLRGRVRLALALLLSMVAQAWHTGAESAALRPWLAPYIAWLSFAVLLNLTYALR